MFSLLVRRNGLIEPPELGRVDHHCHILPGIDDGPSTLQGSLEIAHLLFTMGIRKIVATPHVISDLFPNTSSVIVEAVNTLQQYLDLHRVGIRIVAGAEYYCEPALLALVARDDLLSFGEQKYVLFESPVRQAPAMLKELTFSLKGFGYSPLLAHAERYHFLQRDFDLAVELKRIGVSFQVNHPSFLLPGTSRSGNLARLLYKKGMVDVLGSDMHRATGRAGVQPEKVSRV